MNLSQIIVTVLGLGSITLIYWFFFGDKTSENVKESLKTDQKGKMSVNIIVDGGYKPAVIFLDKGKKTTLKIIRKDSNTCLSDIILPDFKLSKYLPLNKEVQINVTPEKEGEYLFHCGMNMFHGKIVVG